MESLLNQYLNVRKGTEDICKPLKTEDYILLSEDYVNTPKWYFDHTGCSFQMILLPQYYKEYQVFNRDNDFIFHSYYTTLDEHILGNKNDNLQASV